MQDMDFISYLRSDSENDNYDYYVIEKIRRVDESLKYYHCLDEAHRRYLPTDLSKLNVNEKGYITYDSLIDFYNYDINDNPKRVFDIQRLVLLEICEFFYISSGKTITPQLGLIQLFEQDNDTFEQLIKAVPEKLQDYYREVIFNRKEEPYYFNDYIKEQQKNGNGNGVTLIKSTAAGKLMTNEEAYVNVLLFPALFVLIYLLIVVTYFLLNVIL